MKNIDINKTIDGVKLKWYHEWLATHIYDEGESGFHEQLTRQVVTKYVDPIQLPKDAKILDMGCGPGYFMNEMKQRMFECWYSLFKLPSTTQTKMVRNNVERALSIIHPDEYEFITDIDDIITGDNTVLSDEEKQQVLNEITRRKARGGKKRTTSLKNTKQNRKKSKKSKKRRFKCKKMYVK